MIYDTPVRDEDGCYVVKVRNDDNKKCLIQLNSVMVQNMGQEVQLNIKGKRHLNKIQPIDDENIRTAVERSSEWFGKNVSESLLSSMYSRSITPENTLLADKIKASKIFNANNELCELGEFAVKCNVLLEFAGIWFAKKTFGPIWNVVQVKIQPEPVVEPEPEPEPEYPEEYALNDDVSADEEDEE